MTSTKAAALSHDEIISHLRGQTLRVPDLTALFSHWPSPTTNPDYHPLRTTVEQAIDSISSIRPSSQRRQKDDLASLTSLWYPTASHRGLKTLALYTVWLVCWDDEVDANEGDLASDFAKAEAWRNETLKIWRKALRLDDDTTSSGNEDPLHSLVTVVGSDLQVSYTQDQRQRLYESVSLFIRSCGTEQKLRLEKTIPDYDSYMSMRLETVGGATLCSLIEFAHGHHGSPLGSSPAREQLDKQVSVLLSLLNDLLSLKKELRTECVINAVATLMTKDTSLSGVVADVVEKMKAAIRVFDAAAAELEDSYSSEVQRLAARTYVDGCKSIVTGTLEFTLKSPRYKLASLLAADGSLEIVL